ncbi:MAG: amino acid permease [Deltaproteobacteria bacterium]|nr:amino acid permease [Deltaproteobacteria bacterium]
MKGIFSLKSIESILKEVSSGQATLRRVLGPVQLTLLGVGAIIGAGIFATIGTAAAGDVHRLGAGPALMLSFVLTAIACGFTALCYAEFASMVPISGSAYTYAYATLGEVVAWIIGWDLIIEYAVGNVAVAISWANYFKTLVRPVWAIPDWLSTDFTTAQKIPGLIENAPHFLGIPIIFNLLSFGIVALITVILVIGIRESAWFNAVMVIIKLVVLSFFAVVGMKYMNTDNWQPFMPNGWEGVASGAAVIFFAYIGFDAVSTVAEESKNPQRDLPIGIIASLIICTIFYILIAAVFTGIIPYPDLAKTLSTQQAEPLTLAFEYANIGKYKGLYVFIIALGSVIAHTAVLFVFQLGQPRIFFAMARDGLLPPWFAGIHPRFRTPHVTTILTGVGVGVASMFSSLDEMVDLTNIGTLFAFILVCVGIVILRVKDPRRERPFKVPGGLLLPILGALSCLGLIYYLPPTSWLRFASWLNIGLVIYICYGSVHSHISGRSRHNNHLEHKILSSSAGSWLTLIATTLLLMTHIADLARGKGALLTENSHTSWWLLLPLILNSAILIPTILWRLQKSDQLSGDLLRRASRGKQIAWVTLAGNLFYLWYVF